MTPVIDNSYALGLASAATTMEAVALAILTFVAGRAVTQSRTKLGVYGITLLGVAAASVYTLACNALSWWAWHDLVDAPVKNFLFGWSSEVWFAIIFAPPALFSLICLSASLYEFGKRGIRKLRSSEP